MFLIMKEEEIIQYAPEKMQEMLHSVLYYISHFNDKKLLRKVLFAMSVVDRKFFVSDEAYAYYDTALPVGKGQTISQPSVVAAMLMHAELEEGDSVLEIGAGSGWNASLIAFLVYPGNVKSVDRIGGLVEKARENLANLRNHLKQTKPQDVAKLEKLNFLVEDVFSRKKIWKKKYDKIIITAGIGDKETENRVEQIAENLLKKNGLLICPYVSGPMLIYKKKNKKLERKETREQYLFVPLLEGVEE